MSQNKKPKQGKRVPAYSADSMVVSLVAGLVLISLGALILLAAALKLDGDIFHLLRTFSYGVTGTLAIALPVVPIWGGVLVIISTQRKPPVRPFVLGCVILLLICTTITLLTFDTAGVPLLEIIQTDAARSGLSDAYPTYLSDGYQYGCALKRPGYHIGGGWLGMLLAWPLWTGFGAVGGGVIAILLALVAFLFMIRLDVKGIFTNMKQSAAARAAKHEQQLLLQREQELAWQQEQAIQQEQLRLQQEQARLQQIQQAQQQRVQPAPQQPPLPATGPQPVPQPSRRQRPVQPPADPQDPWSSMMPAGTANWNQNLGSTQPPLVQRVEPPKKQRAAKKPPQIGFEPTPEEQGFYAPAQSLPETDPGEKKGLFSRGKDTDPNARKRRKGIFSRDPEEDEVLPGEATQPAPGRREAPQPAAAPEAPETLAPQTARHTGPVQTMAPAAQPTGPVQTMAPATQPAPAQPAAEPRRKGLLQRLIPETEEIEEPDSFDEPAQPAPAARPACPVREGSFMARLQAAAGGEAPVHDSAEPAPRRPRKDTPSAWSQPDADAGSASWRTGDAPVRPSPRTRTQASPVSPSSPVSPASPAAAAVPEAPKKQQAKASWADTPPWEDSPEYVDVVQPDAPVVPVLTREPPEGAWKPDYVVPVRRSMNEMPDGAMMETEPERPYVYPPLNLLKDPEPQAGISPEEDELRSRRLENTLQSFRVPAKVRHITHGPAISRFELELAAGIKVSKVTDLNRNIAMNMEVKSVRIEAPIPGKSLVGVEVPNRERATVTLREVLESEPMRRATKPLIVALGKDIAGTPIVCDLAKMPHLLIAGATGSGKSVCINTIVNSLLYRCSPKEVRLILVDPKVVELQCYNGIPHLLVPVVSDPHKASGALAWAVGEMMDRYRRFQEAGVRAIDGFNENLPDGEEKMPRIVIIIDELADLMMTCKKDVEERICRLAQLARAAGIHLIVATQRPSVDVITGLIKANIPSRIAFKVSSNVDSRTILDRIGAEQLLGYGDMLYMPTGEFTPIRVQGCFLSDDEVNRITDFIRESCPATYDPRVLEELDKLQSEDNVVIPEGGGAEEYTGGDGDLLMQCIEMAVNDGQVSTSLIQRRLKLGYARAGRLVDEMEKRGIVSQKDGAKPRMCLISREEFEVMKDNGAFD